MSEFLIVVLLTVHLLTMNLASAGPLVGLWLRHRGRANLELADQLGHRLAWLSVGALVAGMLGGGLLLTVPASEPLWEALRRFPPRAYLFAGLELLFSLTCLLVYACTWHRFGKRNYLHTALALLSASNLMYHFPPLMAVIGKLAVNPAWTIKPTIDRKILLELAARDDVVSLTIHFSMASFAVAGVTALWLLARRGKQALDGADSRLVARVMAGVALVATVLQLPVGMWVLVSMSRVSRDALMGSSPMASLPFLAAIVLAILLMGRLLAVTLGEVRLKELHRAGWLLLLTTLMMTATMRYSRGHGYNEGRLTVYLAASSPSSGSFSTSSNGPPGSLLAFIKSP